MICDVPPPISYYEEMVSPYRDSFGLIAQGDSDRDGGDTAHRIGVYYFGLYLLYKENKIILSQVKEMYLKDLGMITKEKGLYVRHPDEKKWYSDPANFSRDQSIPITVSLGAFNEKERLQDLFDRHIKRFGFYPNIKKNWTNEVKTFPFDYRDVMGPQHLGMYIRSFNSKKYSPLLYITDIGLLGDVIAILVDTYFKPSKTSNDINVSLLLLQSEDRFPTFISRLAIKVYTKYRQLSFPTKVGFKSNKPIQTAWDYYFEYPDPPLGEVYICPILNYFYQKDF